LKRSDGMIPPESLTDLPDRELWRRSRVTDATEDDAARFLDLAGFADGLLDPDERERVAASLAHDPVGAADVAAAQALAGASITIDPLSERAVARACALAASAEAGDNVVRFAARPRPRFSLPGAARWSSLAAAVVLASWLGFRLGMDVSSAFAVPGQSDDSVLNELFDPTVSLLHDLTEDTQT
jgi:anti-sigma factor RsiW